MDLTRHNSANVTRTDCTSNDIRHMYTPVGFCMTTDESLHYYFTATTTIGAISYSVGLNVWFLPEVRTITSTKCQCHVSQRWPDNTLTPWTRSVQSCSISIFSHSTLLRLTSRQQARCLTRYTRWRQQVQYTEQCKSEERSQDIHHKRGYSAPNINIEAEAWHSGVSHTPPTSVSARHSYDPSVVLAAEAVKANPDWLDGAVLHLQPWTGDGLWSQSHGLRHLGRRMVAVLQQSVAACQLVLSPVRT